jgi:hypothetical protein
MLREQLAKFRKHEDDFSEALEEYIRTIDSNVESLRGLREAIDG